MASRVFQSCRGSFGFAKVLRWDFRSRPPDPKPTVHVEAYIWPLLCSGFRGNGEGKISVGIFCQPIFVDSYDGVVAMDGAEISDASDDHDS